MKAVTGAGSTITPRVVFKLSPAGTQTVLHTFTGAFSSGPDGFGSIGGVILDSACNLCDTTYIGGAEGSGTVFKVDAAGTETVLYKLQRVHR